MEKSIEMKMLEGLIKGRIEMLEQNLKTGSQSPEYFEGRKDAFEDIIEDIKNIFK